MLLLDSLLAPLLILLEERRIPKVSRDTNSMFGNCTSCQPEPINRRIFKSHKELKLQLQPKVARLNRFNGGTCSSWQSCGSIEKVNRLVVVYSARSRDSRRVNGNVESSWQTGRHVFVSTNGLGKNKVEWINSGAREKARTHGQTRNSEKSSKIILTVTDGVDRWISRCGEPKSDEFRRISFRVSS